MQNSHQLAFIFMNAFGMNDEHAVRVNDNAVGFKNFLSQTNFVGLFDFIEFFDEVFVIGKIGNSFQQIEIGNPVVADFRRDKVRQGRIGMQQPTPRRNAVGHVGEFFRPQFIEFRNQ